MKPAAETAASSTATAGETEQQIRDRVGKEEQQRHADIAMACDLAGKPERASAFVAARTPLSEVLATLVRAASPRPKG